jgi:hypothetical protein
MRVKAVWMDVDHDVETIQTIGTGDAHAVTAIMTDMAITTVVGMTGTETLTGITVDTEMAIEIGMEVGIAAAASHWSKMKPE